MNRRKAIVAVGVALTAIGWAVVAGFVGFCLKDAGSPSAGAAAITSQTDAIMEQAAQPAPLIPFSATMGLTAEPELLVAQAVQPAAGAMPLRPAQPAFSSPFHAAFAEAADPGIQITGPAPTPTAQGTSTVPGSQPVPASEQAGPDYATEMLQPADGEVSLEAVPGAFGEPSALSHDIPTYESAAQPRIEPPQQAPLHPTATAPFLRETQSPPFDYLPAESPDIASGPAAAEANSGMQVESLGSAEQFAQASAGPQSPSVTIAWNGPRGVNVGDVTACELVVKNNGTTVTQNALVDVRFLSPVRLMASDPKPIESRGAIRWELGTLEPNEERHIQLQVVPERAGELLAVAQVTFSAASAARIRVDQPQLALNVRADEETVVGDAFTCTLEVSNPGTGSAEHVVVEALLPEGLDHPGGKQLSYPIGTLGSGETRAVRIAGMIKSAGTHVVTVLARTTAGEGSSVNPALEAEAQASVHGVAPALQVALSGPKLRYVNRNAIYTIEATNPGSSPTSNVRVVHAIPEGFEFVEADGGGMHDPVSHTVAWFVGKLDPGQTSQMQVTLVATGLGEHEHHVTAQAERGLAAEADEVTRVEGISALLLEVVDVDDPIEVGAESGYDIRVTNQGSKAASNLQVVAEVPQELDALAAEGPTGYGVENRQIVFKPLPSLAPGADVKYHVSVRGLEAGDVRFRVWLKGDSLSKPVLKEESTRVYSD